MNAENPSIKMIKFSKVLTIIFNYNSYLDMIELQAADPRIVADVNVSEENVKF